jgi:cell division protein FtsQ
MRERRLSVKRAQTRKRLKWVALGLLVVTVVVGGLALLGSSLFAVKADQIDVVGAVYTDDDELQRIIDDLADTPALRVDVGRLEAELEAIPWVERAEVTVDFPSAATIDIRERQPMTTYQGPDGRYRVLDRGGRVLDVIDGYPFAYVLITGPDPVDLDPGEFAPRGYAAASELARNLTPPVRGRVATLEVAADGSSLDMILDDGRLVRFGEARELFAKLVRLDRVLTSGQELADGPIDVSTEEVTVPLAAGEDG